MKKTLIEHSQGHLSAEPVSQPLPVLSSRDPNLRFDLPPIAIQDDKDEYSISCIEKELSAEMGTWDAVAHDYVLGFTSGLDDFLSLPEFTDIG